MIPEKTPVLVALAWIVVATAYAWTSNRDYDDAVLARRAGSVEREAGSEQRKHFAPHPSPLAPRPTLTTGEHP